MQFILFGLVVAALAGPLAWVAVRVATRRRRLPPLARGVGERAAIYAIAILAGPVVLAAICWLSGGTVGPEFGEEMMMLGPAMAMPASAVAAWLLGELVSGPTQRGWKTLATACAAAEVGFLLGSIGVGLLGLALSKAHLLPANPSSAVETAVSVPLPFAIGGATSAWAYVRLRGPVSCVPPAS